LYFIFFSLKFTFSDIAHRLPSELMAEAAVRPVVGGVEAFFLFETVDIPDFTSDSRKIAVG